MKKSLFAVCSIICTVLFFSFAVYADPVSVRQLAEIAEKVTAEKYPDSNTVLLFNEENIRYEADGLSVATDEYYQKILTESGRKQLRSCSFQFNSTYGSLQIEKAQIIRKGKIINIDPAANSRISVEPGQMGSNIYDPANKILSLSVPGLKIGDVLGLKIRSVEKKVRIPGFWGSYIPLQGDMPILHYAVNIDAPAEKPLRSVVIKDPAGTPVKFSKEQKNGRIIYRWLAENVPQVIPEPDMPPLYTSVQRLLTGTAANWEEISKWYYALCRPHLDKADRAIRDKVAELTGKCKNDDEKIMALFQFVSQQIRYMGITPESEAPGYEPHDVTMTFHQRYGVCRDKAVLLVSMLEIAGFKAYPVLFMAGIPKDDDVPNGYFNHAITAVETAPGKYILMDPTNESARDFLPATLGNCSYLVAKPEGDRLRRTLPPDPALNRLAISGSSKLDGSGTLTGTVKLDFTGVNDMIYRDALSRWTPEEAEQYFARCIGRAIPGAELAALEISPVPVRNMSRPLSVTCRYTAEGIMPDTAAPFVLQLPELGDNIGASGFLLGSFALEKRKFKLKLESTFSVQEQYKMELPGHLKILSMPQPEELGRSGLIRWCRKNSLKDNVLEGSRSFSAGALEFSPEEYQEARRVLMQMDMKKRALPVAVTDFSLVKKENFSQMFAGADTLILKDWKKYTVKNENLWTEESVRRFRILSYAGVKDASELHIEYNPVMEQVEVSGKVISPSGRVSELKELEKNQMDAPWNSTAPRYPGAKILVANLPGVEVGSEVEVKIRKTIRRPWFSAVMTFGGYAPEIERVRVLDIPARMRVRYSDLPAGVFFDQKTTGARRILSWSAANMRRIPAERNQAELWSFVPTVMVSAGNWQNIAGNMKSTFLKLSDVSANPKSLRLAGELIKTLPSGGSEKEQLMRKVTAVRDHVARSIRAAGPGLSELPLENLSPADVTLRSGYGSSADRAILLGAMLKALDIDSEFVPVSGLLYSERHIRGFERFPQQIFNDVLLYVPSLDIYLNDTSQYAEPGTLNSADRIMFSLRNRRTESLRVRHRYESSIRRQIKIDIKKDGSADIKISDLYSGSEFESANRKYSEFTPELRRRHFASLASRLSRAAELRGVPVTDFRSYPGKVEYTLHCPGFVSSVGRYREFDLPFFGVFAEAAGTVGKSRKTPFIRDKGFVLSVGYDISYPEEFTVSSSRPAKLQLGDFSIGNFVQDCAVSRGKLNIDGKINIRPGIIPAVDCDRLFTFRRTLARPDAGKVILIPHGEKRK